ncbi:MAG: DNA-binding protein YbiB [Pseudomonadota bacterium]|nr:DNA-binding protein YbiB [Pseudomonadota bacterium]
MGISPYIKEIGRGAQGARALSREQAADLLCRVLDGHCSDFEIGAFCVAMRIKGETPDEMAGFLDALNRRLTKLPASDRPVVVLPSYNGARKLPGLTALLALLLAREGLPVLVHGTPTEDTRVGTQAVLAALGVHPSAPHERIDNGRVHFVATERLHPGLKRLLDVRRAIGLRNPAHALVKLMNPVDGPALVVASYTHPEYAESMGATFQLTRTPAMLLRGTEGEPVADARRTPRMDVFTNGVARLVQEAQSGPLRTLPALPDTTSAAATADYIRDVMAGRTPPPEPIACQAEHIARACESIATENPLPFCPQQLAA